MKKNNFSRLAATLFLLAACQTAPPSLTTPQSESPASKIKASNTSQEGVQSKESSKSNAEPPLAKPVDSTAPKATTTAVVKSQNNDLIVKYSQAFQSHQKEIVQNTRTLASSMPSNMGPAPTATPMISPSASPSGSSETVPSSSPSTELTLLLTAFKTILEVDQKVLAELSSMSVPEEFKYLNQKLQEGLQREVKLYQAISQEFEANKITSISDLSNFMENYYKSLGITLDQHQKLSMEFLDTQFEVIRLGKKAKAQLENTSAPMTEEEYAKLLNSVWAPLSLAITGKSDLSVKSTFSPNIKDLQSFQTMKSAAQTLIERLGKQTPPSQYEELHYTLLVLAENTVPFSEQMQKSFADTTLLASNPTELLKKMFSDSELFYTFYMMGMDVQQITKETLVNQINSLVTQAKDFEMKQIFEAPVFEGKVTATAQSTGFNLAWTSAPAATTSIAIYRNEPEKIFKSVIRLATLEKASKTYLDEGGLVTGKSYQYTVCFLDTKGNILAAGLSDMSKF